MLRKLMKYEFKATGRVFLPLFAALLIIASVNKLLFTIGADINAPQIIGIIAAVMLTAGIFFITIILTIQRFWKNILTDEGYLSMTLPVSADSLILSKLFTASIWAVSSFIVVVISIFIMTLTENAWQNILNFFADIGWMFSRLPAQMTVLIVELIVFIVLAIFASILMLYACMSLSQLADNRRVLFAFGAYIAISIILQIISAIIITIGAALETQFKWLTKLFEGLTNPEQAQLIILAMIIITALLSVAFYFTTRYMMKNKLNLQ